MAENYLSFKTNDNNERVFDSQSAVSMWLRALHGLYSFDDLLIEGLQTNFQQHVLSIFRNQVQPHIKALQQSLTEQNIAYNALLAGREAEKLFEQGLLIDPLTTLGSAILELKGKDKLAAFYVLCLLHEVKAAILPSIENNRFPILSKSLIAAINLFMAYRPANTNQIDSAKADFDGFRKASEAHLREVIERATSILSSMEVNAKQFEEAWESTNRRVKGDFAVLEQKMESLSAAAENQETNRLATNQALEDLLSETKQKLNKLSATYEASVKTDAAFKYWAKKKFWHTVWAGAFVPLGIASAVAIFFAALWVKRHLPAASITDFPYWAPFVLVLFALAAVWYGRVLVRLFMSQVNLREDAAERATMAQTYVALVKEGAASNQDHMAIVLQALFRPSGKGLGADDGSPQLPLEVLLKQLK